MADEKPLDVDQPPPVIPDPLADLEVGPGDETVRVIGRRPIDTPEPPKSAE